MRHAEGLRGGGIEHGEGEQNTGDDEKNCRTERRGGHVIVVFPLLPPPRRFGISVYGQFTKILLANCAPQAIVVFV